MNGPIFTDSQKVVLKERDKLERLLDRNAYLTAELESLQEDIRLAQQDLMTAIFRDFDPTMFDEFDSTTAEDDDDSGN